MMPIETERTIIRAWRDDDAPRLLDILGRMEVVRWLDDDPKPLVDLDAARAKVATFAERAVPGTPIGFWAVEELATGVVAGTVLLTPLEAEVDGVSSETTPDDGLEVGWWFHPDAWGRGLAREAAAALVEAALASGIPKVNALMYVDNEASATVALAIGLEEQPISHDRWYAGPSRHFTRGA